MKNSSLCSTSCKLWIHFTKRFQSPLHLFPVSTLWFVRHVNEDENELKVNAAIIQDWQYTLFQIVSNVMADEETRKLVALTNQILLNTVRCGQKP